MKNLFQPVIILSFSLLFSSCFEVTEEVSMKNNGSGDVLLTINLSESKDNLKAFWKMDQVEGVDVPKKAEIDQEIAKVKQTLTGVKGFSNVNTTANYEEFIFTVGGSFDNVSTLNKAINAVISSLNRSPIPVVKKNNFDYVPGKFSRLFNYSSDFQFSEEEYNNLNISSRFVMETARVVGVYRFESPVKNFTNKKAELSPNKKAVKFQSTVADIVKGNASIKNEITF